MRIFQINKNSLLAILLLLLAGFVWLEASQLPELGTDLGVVNTAFMPKVIAFLLAALAIPLFFTKTNAGGKIAFDISRIPQKQLVFAALIAVWIGLLPVAGFEITSFLFLLAGMWLLGLKNKFLLIGLPLAVTFCVYFVFIYIMNVPLPNLLRHFIY